MTTYELQPVPLQFINAHPHDFNTAVHAISEYPELRLESQRPFDLKATSFATWLPLIAESRGIEGKFATIGIPNDLVHDLIDAVQLYKASGDVPNSKSLSVAMRFSIQLRARHPYRC